MINTFRDILTYLKTFLIREKRVIFIENLYTLEYLNPLIKKIYKKNPKSKIILISLKKIDVDPTKFILIYFLNNFFLEIFFLTLRFKYIYSTTPGVNTNLFKKTLIGKSKYIYIQHSNISLSINYYENAFINFDAVQVINSYQNIEAYQIREKYNKKFKIFKSKYFFLQNFKKNTIKNNSKFDFLIAPTWKTDFFKNNLFLNIIEKLREKNFKFIVRPHPMSFQEKEVSVEYFKCKKIDIDISPRINFNIFNYLISDWSGIFMEYFLISGYKSILFNTKPKILNYKYKNFTNTPIEFDLRKDIGILFNDNEFEKFHKLLDKIKHDFLDDLKITNSTQQKTKKIFY